jgi:uncharacterized protein YcfL
LTKPINLFLIAIILLTACNLNNSISQSEAEQTALKDAVNTLNITIQNLTVSISYKEDFYHKEKELTYKDTWHIRIDNKEPLLFYYIDSKSGLIIAKGKFNKNTHQKMEETK